MSTQNMSNSIVIYVASHIGNSISTREAVRDLFSSYVNHYQSHNVILDFSGVMFISRAAAHQLLLDSKQSNDALSISIVYKNLNSDLQSMLNTVVKSTKQAMQSEAALALAIGVPVLALSGLALYNYLRKG